LGELSPFPAQPDSKIQLSPVPGIGKIPERLRFAVFTRDLFNGKPQGMKAGCGLPLND
jgi:hypothetical protein